MLVIYHHAAFTAAVYLGVFYIVPTDLQSVFFGGIVMAVLFVFVVSSCVTATAAMTTTHSHQCQKEPQKWGSEIAEADGKHQSDRGE